MKMKMKVIGELEVMALPGREWCWLEEKRYDDKADTSEVVGYIAFPGTPGNVQWSSVTAAIAAVTEDPAYLGRLPLKGGKVWWGGWKTVAEVSTDPDGVMAVVRRLLDEAEVVQAFELEKRL